MTVHNDPVATNAQLNSKVVFLTHYLPPNMASVLRALTRQTKDFQILLSTDQEPNRDYGTAWEGLNVRVQKSWMLRQPWKHAKGGFQDELYVHIPYDTFSQLRQANPDIVFSHELGVRSLISAFYCKLARKKLALYVCVSERTEQGRGFNFLRAALRRLLLRAADAVAYNGPSCLAYLKKLRTTESKLYYFPYAATEELQYAGSIERQPHARRRLLVVGQLIARKGVLPLLNALIEYGKTRPERIVEVNFAGKGEQESAIRAAKLPGNLKVRLLGSLNFAEMAREMENCGVMVFPTLADEWGMVVNEAMHAGMPVIGSEHAQASTTLIRHGENGWLYNPDLPETLFSALDEMFTLSEAQLLSIRQAALETVREITPNHVAQLAVNMLQKLRVPS